MRLDEVLAYIYPFQKVKLRDGICLSKCYNGPAALIQDLPLEKLAAKVDDIYTVKDEIFIAINCNDLECYKETEEYKINNSVETQISGVKKIVKYPELVVSSSSICIADLKHKDASYFKNKEKNNG